MNKDVAKHVQNGIQALTTAMLCYPSEEDQAAIKNAVDALIPVKLRNQPKRKKK